MLIAKDRGLNWIPLKSIVKTTTGKTKDYNPTVDHRTSYRSELDFASKKNV